MFWFISFSVPEKKTADKAKKKGLFQVSSRKKNRVGRSAFLIPFVQTLKKHFPFKNLVKQASCKSYKANSAIVCNF